MRRRINRNAIASSYNYKRSRELHLEFIKNREIVSKKRYVTVFGKKVEVTDNEYKNHSTLCLIS